jgi:CRISPR system Cascade subunit CasE
MEKALNNGFKVISCRVIPEGIIQNERGRGNKEKLRHYAVRFEGTLEVVNPDNFSSALFNGIGSAKGFGFGLLSIAPVKAS